MVGKGEAAAAGGDVLAQGFAVGIGGEEAGKLGDPAAEKVTIIARKRMEIAS